MTGPWDACLWTVSVICWGKPGRVVSDFVNLQVGDVIKIDKKVDQELEVYVGNIKKFTALPGYFENKYAVRVTNVIREESEE